MQKNDCTYFAIMWNNVISIKSTVTIDDRHYPNAFIIPHRRMERH